MIFHILSKTYGSRYVLVDDEDWDKIKDISWCLERNSSYKHSIVLRVKGRIKRANKHVFLHRYIMDTPRGKVVDHLNGNPLDNRRENLNNCDHQLNSERQRKTVKKTSSKYKGVSFHIRRKKWISSIKTSGKVKYLGYFLSEREAAIAYNNHIDTHKLDHLKNIID